MKRLWLSEIRYSKSFFSSSRRTKEQVKHREGDRVNQFRRMMQKFKVCTFIFTHYYVNVPNPMIATGQHIDLLKRLNWILFCLLFVHISGLGRRTEPTEKGKCVNEMWSTHRRKEMKKKLIILRNKSIDSPVQETIELDTKIIRHMYTRKFVY